MGRWWLVAQWGYLDLTDRNKLRVKLSCFVARKTHFFLRRERPDRGGNTANSSEFELRVRLCAFRFIFLMKSMKAGSTEYEEVLKESKEQSEAERSRAMDI